MSGLILKLRANEQVLINGVVIQNGDSKSKLKIKTADARILRLRDAMHPSEANTPVKRAYYTAQLGLTGDLPEKDAVESLGGAIKELRFAFATIDQTLVLDKAEAFLECRNFYRLMREIRSLIKVEDALLAMNSRKPRVFNNERVLVANPAA